MNTPRSGAINPMIMPEAKAFCKNSYLIMLISSRSLTFAW
jgi:hypothetical protein